MKRTPIKRASKMRTRSRREKTDRTKRINLKRALTRAVSTAIGNALAPGGYGLVVGALIGERMIAEERAADRADYIIKRTACRVKVIADDMLCRCGCGRPISDVHEEPPRSQGGDETNPDDCLGLAQECHYARHFERGEKRLRIRRLDVSTRGPVEFTKGRRRWVTIPSKEGPQTIRQELLP